MPRYSPLPPQAEDFLSELKQGPRTSLQLIRATGSIRPGAVIHLLRIAGFKIETQIIKVPTRHRRPAHVARYTLRVRARRARVKAAEKRRQPARSKRSTGASTRRKRAA